ncbi:MAG: phytanoyl-CoA dioxygenase family protein [Acidimicrobiales bacterium]
MFRLRSRTAGDVDAAQLRREAERAEADGRLIDALDLLRRANRAEPDPDTEAHIVELRHLGFDRLEGTTPLDGWPRSLPDLFPDDEGIPEVGPDQLTTERLGSAMVNHGALLVRGLVEPDLVVRLVEGIDRAFEGRDAWEAEDDHPTTPWFVPFVPSGRFAGELSRKFVREGGAVWTGDSPRVLFEVLENYDRVGLADVIGGYLGERPVISLRKSTLRRVPPDLAHTDWHQDGAFLGADVRSVNVWLALTDCGADADAPGLDYLPRRVDHVLETGTEGAFFDWSVGPDLVTRLADEMGAPIVRPAFRAGDALLFDDVFLHRTGIGEHLSRPRYAIESWFFAPSRYPDDQIPLVF